MRYISTLLGVLGVLALTTATAAADGFHNQGWLNQGWLNQGWLNQGWLNQGWLNQGWLNGGSEGGYSFSRMKTWQGQEIQNVALRSGTLTGSAWVYESTWGPICPGDPDSTTASAYLPVDVAPVRSADGRLALYARGADGALWQTYHDGGATSWTRLGDGVIDGAPAATVIWDGRTVVFARGTDGALYHKYDAGGWTSWLRLGSGAMGSAPSATVDRNGRILVFVRGTDGVLYHMYYDGGWSDWIGIPGGAISSAPSATVTADGRLIVFARGTDDGLYYRTYESNGWTSWIGLPGGKISSAPSATVAADGRLFVFARGTDDRLYYRYAQSGASNWTGWIGADGGAIGSAPAAVVNRDGTLMVFARGTDNRLYYREIVAGWSGWRGVGTQSCAAGVRQDWNYRALTPSEFEHATIDVAVTDPDTEAVLGSMTLRIADVVAVHDGHTYDIEVAVHDTSTDGTRASTWQWKSACGCEEGTSGATCDAVPAVALQGRWNYTRGTVDGGRRISDDANFVTFACMNGALGKCGADKALVPRGMGYQPWRGQWTWRSDDTWVWDDLRDEHQTCTRMVTADYCGDGRPHTYTGMPIEVYDAVEPRQINYRTPSSTWALEAAWEPDGATFVSCLRVQRLPLNPAPNPAIGEASNLCPDYGFWSCTGMGCAWTSRRRALNTDNNECVIPTNVAGMLFNESAGNWTPPPSDMIPAVN